VQLDVFTTAFRKVKSATYDFQAAGTYPLAWDGTDNSGEAVSNGLYYIRFTILGPRPQTQTFKVLILR
jgi:flagellar hook assembly protein FlgD